MENGRLVAVVAASDDGVRLAKFLCPTVATNKYDGDKFFTRRKGLTRATPLFGGVYEPPEAGVGPGGAMPAARRKCSAAQAPKGSAAACSWLSPAAGAGSGAFSSATPPGGPTSSPPRPTPTPGPSGCCSPRAGCRAPTSARSPARASANA